MNMNKALQNLYHAVSNETTTKVNISKLLVDIHYAITGKESENKNNWSKIVNSMADNWPEGGGGGGSSDISTAEVTIVNPEVAPIINGAFAVDNGWGVLTGSYPESPDNVKTLILYKGVGYLIGPDEENVASTTGAIEYDSDEYAYKVTGDCSITFTISPSL